MAFTNNPLTMATKDNIIMTLSTTDKLHNPNGGEAHGLDTNGQ